MIINIRPSTFGGAVRNGDLVAVVNVIQHLRKSDPSIKFHMLPGSINSADYCMQFYNFLLETTDFFSAEPGNRMLPWHKVNLWDFRDISGDCVSIKNETPMKKKICIFPVLDATYNTYRNWPLEHLQNMIAHYSSSGFDEYERVLCVKSVPQNLDLHKFSLTTDFMQNIHNIMDCEIFIGGDTGTSHFAWALDRGPRELIYWSSSRGLVHTLPFYLVSGKGSLNSYYVNCDGSTF